VRQLSGEHLAALGAMAVAIGAAVATARRAPGRAPALSRGLALIVLAGWVAEQVANVVLGTWSARFNLPLQLTDAVSLTAVVALWRPRALLVELTYFWALTASLQATLTPDLAQSFPSIFYFTYFTYHCGAIVAASLLVFGRGLYPRRRAAWRVFAATLAFTALAAAGDLVTGGNYMYLRAKPEHASLLSVMGPWPWYIVETAVVGLGLLLGLQALTGVARRRDLAVAGRADLM
jgi:hypothetical integral membrane protein (TIGR02206 family)